MNGLNRYRSGDPRVVIDGADNLGSIGPRSSVPEGLRKREACLNRSRAIQINYVSHRVNVERLRSNQV